MNTSSIWCLNFCIFNLVITFSPKTTFITWSSTYTHGHARTCTHAHTHMGRRVIGISDLWSGQKILINWYLTPVVNFGEVRCPQLAKYSTSRRVGAPGIFSDLLKFVQMLKREWGAKSNGKLSHIFIPSKTATLVPEFAVEQLPLHRTTAWVPEYTVKDLTLGRTLRWYNIKYKILNRRIEGFLCVIPSLKRLN